MLKLSEGVFKFDIGLIVAEKIGVEVKIHQKLQKTKNFVQKKGVCMIWNFFLSDNYWGWSVDVAAQEHWSNQKPSQVHNDYCSYRITNLNTICEPGFIKDDITVFRK